VKVTDQDVVDRKTGRVNWFQRQGEA